MFALVYVFDTRVTTGTIVRCPVFVARWIVRSASAPLDYAVSPEGW